MSGFGELRGLALEVNLDVHGFAVTVQRPEPDITPIVTTGIWLQEAGPGVLDLGRPALRRTLVLPSAEVPTVPSSTVILAPEVDGGPVLRWRVDGHEAQQPGQWRVVVVPDPQS